jgi:hypothetical protein
MTAPIVLDDRTPRWRRWTDLQSLRASLDVVLRTVGRHAVVMGIVYAITLGVAMAAAQLVTMRAIPLITWMIQPSGCLNERSRHHDVV